MEARLREGQSRGGRCSIKYGLLTPQQAALQRDGCCCLLKIAGLRSLLIAQRALPYYCYSEKGFRLMFIVGRR